MVRKKLRAESTIRSIQSMSFGFTYIDGGERSQNLYFAWKLRLQIAWSRIN